MIVFITDNQKQYSDCGEEFKLLISNGIIRDHNFHDKETIFHFNSQQNAIENDAAELMIDELKKTAAKCPDFIVNPYLKTRSKFDIAYSLLYPNFKNYVYKKYWIRLFIENLLSFSLVKPDDKFKFNLSDSFFLIETDEVISKYSTHFEFYHSGVTSKLSFFKNVLYKVYSLAFSPKKKEFVPANPKAIKVALIIYDTFNDVDLFRTFLGKIKDNPLFNLTIIQIGSGIPLHQRYYATEFNSSNIKCYKLEEFRDYVGYDNSDFNKKIQTVNTSFSVFSKHKINENIEVYYSFVANALEKIKPDVTIYDNTGDVGRVVSDVSRYYKIPSVNVEYGLFSDDAIHMEGSIKFDYRVCLGQASIDLWKKRNDPTLHHVPIGFLKLDNVEVNQFNKKEFYSKHKLNLEYPTLFFASTWAGTNELYNIEKQEIVKQLAFFCEENKLNLIIKKHPAENDNLLNEALEPFSYKELLICNHNEINLYEAIFYSDIVSTQSSSVSVEALALSRPVIFFNLSQSKSLADLSVMKGEDFVYLVNNIDDFGNVVLKLLREKDSIDYDTAKKKYLYKTDGLVHHRLIELIEKISKEFKTV